MLDAVEGDYSNADVKQDGVYWYGVQIKRDSTGNSYTLSYMDSNKDSYNSDKTGFDINKAIIWSQLTQRQSGSPFEAWMAHTKIA